MTVVQTLLLLAVVESNFVNNLKSSGIAGANLINNENKIWLRSSEK